MPEVKAPQMVGVQASGASAMNPNLGTLRGAEFELLLTKLRPGSTILEIGGGSGFQAKLLKEAGFEVRSIDIENPKGNIGQHFPVEIYDGKLLPVENARYDYVISSNVLEHIPTLETTFNEIRRVMAPEGRAIHILPSAVWRWSTTMARYPFMLKVALGLKKTSGTAGRSSQTSKSKRLLSLAKRVLFEPPHGEFPGAISELYHFRGKTWQRVFEQNGFEVLERLGNGLFYTGYSTFPNLNLHVRRRLALMLGSSCHVFVMRTKQ